MLDPIRSEIWSVERLEEYAATLAATQGTRPGRRWDRPLTPRVWENGRVLLACYRTIAASVRNEQAMTPAAEWLVDNFHLVEEQLREIREDFPRGYYRLLPKLAGGTFAGFPRVYSLAFEFVAHTDSRFDAEALRRFIRAYQRTQPLTLGELWAVPISLRVVLVENLRRLAERMVGSRRSRERAKELADPLLESGKSGEIAARLERYDARAIDGAFVAVLLSRLRDQDPAVSPVLAWLDRRLAERGQTVEDLIAVEHQRQTATNATVRNIITAIREISIFDWKAFVEKVSRTDELLAVHAGYRALDFATRDSYRHAIEDLSRGSGRAETEVARLSLALAAAGGAAHGGDAAEADPGFYLLAGGRSALESELGYKAPFRGALRRAILRRPTGFYLGSLATVTAVLLALPLALQAATGGAGTAGWALWGLGLLALLPATDLALHLVNDWVMDLLGPRLLPRLELREGVPPQHRTLVAVPMMLGSEAQIDEQLNRLEVHFLANPEPELAFALLSDWTDAPAETMPGDEALLARAGAGIAALNERHGPAPSGFARFHLLHRRRLWNEGEQSWIGWERKRGKLEELNRLLRGGTGTTYLDEAARAAALPPDVRYVLTLDADTRLPRESARRLIGTLAHPLNRPRWSSAAGRVVAGYGVLQPRVVPLLAEEHEGSLLQTVFAGAAGIDPYASAVSDVYQDLFGEGSFVGKGLYDVDAFRAALDGRVPEGAVLSHDLLEGLFARAGLVTDVELFDEFPNHFAAYSGRQHRWARGDWQLLPWIFGRGPRAATLRTPLPAIGRFKMLDNLRRTLSAPAAFLSLLAAWTLPGANPAIWTAFVLATLALPPLTPFLRAIPPPRSGISKRSHLRNLANSLALGLAQLALNATFLAHQAWSMGDAAARTLARLRSRRRLLQWVPAAQAQAGLTLALPSFLRAMAGGLTLAVLALVLVAGSHPGSWAWAAAPLLAWLLAPVAARWISEPFAATLEAPPSPEQERELRLIARSTWRWFETFVTAEDNHLPPDNFQEDPYPVVAHRTSPTNIGLYLLAVSAARDFGWIGLHETVERLEAACGTLGKLERFRGHLLNWYDTRNLRPLDPRYVSSVDSGNLAGHLLALAGTLQRMAEEPLLPAPALAGIADALEHLRRAAPPSAGRRTQTVTRRHLDEALAALAPLVATPPASREAWVERLDRLELELLALLDVARALAGEQRAGADAAAWSEVEDWAELARRSAASHRRDLETQDGWPAPPEGAQRRLARLAEQAYAMFDAMDMSFLYDRQRKLLAIGYRIPEHTLDPNYYDLLASEARLASFVAIAKGEVPLAHWFQLGRPLTPVSRGAALISWSGSMFEYLMPQLVLRSHPLSLLDQTCRLVVRRQIRYGAERNVPWGSSESAFNARDLELTYQYSNFGVPGLGLRRGLSEDLVIAPYATALAAMYEPRAACLNFARLERAGARGRFGFYEAVDYTRERLPEGEDHAVVRAYMAHHQGMTLVALANALDVRGDGAMPDRFHSLPLVQATELLLQERTPQGVAVARPRAEEVREAARPEELAGPPARRYTSPHKTFPRSHLLGNGSYTVMLTAAGSGYSRLRDLAVTRFREDSTRDCWGSYLYLRQLDNGKVWSAGYQPTGVEPDRFEVTFGEDRAIYLRRDGLVTCRLEVVVSSEADVELRRVSLSNDGERPLDVEVTSYAEIALAPPAADLAHPAFSNLFVETEWVARPGALLATRRPRSAGEPRVWAAHVVAAGTGSLGELQFETDRLRFLGRGQGVRTPVAVLDGRPLSNSAGAVLDPIFSLRQRVRIPAGGTVDVTFSTLVAGSREEALDLADRYRDPAAFERAAVLAWTKAQVQLRHLGIEPEEAGLFQRVANRIVFSDPTLRPSSEVLQRNRSGPPALWAQGISGDLPIVLVTIDEMEDLGIVRQLLKAYEYFRTKRLAVDLVILNERAPSYVQDLQDALEALVRTAVSRAQHEGHEAHGRVYVLRADLLAADTRDVLLAAAKMVLVARNGTLTDQLVRGERAPKRPLKPRRSPPPETARQAPPELPPLEVWNGLGGFARDGREYVMVLGEGQWTPAPWVNVIANPRFGCLVSESGGGCTWSLNSRENQLTPWSNDPVSDPPGEALFVRDDESGHLWTATPLPIREEGSTYVVRHGQGFSRFEHTSHRIALDLQVFVPLGDPVKISRLAVTNLDRRPRRLSVTAYAEWVLGRARSASAPFVVTSIDRGAGGSGGTGALLARNPWNAEFAGRVAFADLGGRQKSWTADRRELLGRNGTLDHPAALERGEVLSGQVGGGLDPCAALQTPLELAPGEKAEIVFLLGQGASLEEARAVVLRYRSADLDAVQAEVERHWDDTCGALRVRTPERTMDLLLNRWLLYQALSCRVWGRAGFYQASGAYGFRDQLQDVGALAVARRDVAREQILRAASRQFLEGDVQHWWHPPAGKGVRTHISDDLLWLPYTVLHYLDVTGERELLESQVPFLQAPELEPGQEDAYFAPQASEEAGTLYEHCARALDRSLRVGRHGLPLMGTGDWNDGMNRVGREGRGESVWLGWFLIPLLQRFAPLAEERQEAVRARIWREHAEGLRRALERKAWDGDWYLRAFFDDGSPLGTAKAGECRIDSLSQTWSVISGAADPERAAHAMASVDQHLVRRSDSLVLLLAPPFDRTPDDPGYIRGYLPGVRENGGQYSHAAAWVVVAFAALGNGDRAEELFALMNPIHHTQNRAGVQRYKVEPYVLAGDVYAQPSHMGRGGWTWYTGAAGWLYRAGIESILGFRLRGERLRIEPVIPRRWPAFEMTFRYHAATYTIAVENPRQVSRGVGAVEVDGRSVPPAADGGAEIDLSREGEHQVRVVLGAANREGTPPAEPGDLGVQGEGRAQEREVLA